MRHWKDGAASCIDADGCGGASPVSHCSFASKTTLQPWGYPPNGFGSKINCMLFLCAIPMLRAGRLRLLYRQHFTDRSLGVRSLPLTNSARRRAITSPVFRIVRHCGCVQCRRTPPEMSIRRRRVWRGDCSLRPAGGKDSRWRLHGAGYSSAVPLGLHYPSICTLSALSASLKRMGGVVVMHVSVAGHAGVFLLVRNPCEDAGDPGRGHARCMQAQQDGSQDLLFQP